MKAWKIRTMAIATAASAFAAPTASYAGPQGAPSEYCNQEHGEGGDQGGSNQIGQDLCANGPAGCVSVGLYVRVEPNAASSFGATSQVSRSTSNAYSWNGYGQGHGDSAVVKAEVPPTLGEGLIESSCDSTSYNQGGWVSNYASGRAETERFSVNLYSHGIPVALNVDTLREDGSSFNGSGGNSANVVNVTGLINGTPVNVPISAAPNTVVPLGPATLYLNEQTIGFGFCPVYQGDALRLVVTDPTTGLTAATVIVSSVSTSTCP